MHSTIAPVSPSNSVRKMKAILSPLGSPVSSYTNISDLSGPSSPACSPGRTLSSSGNARFSTGSNFSAISLSLRQVRNMIRRKPSTVELELEEERRSCAEDLLGLVEPRPVATAHVNGIEEVLFGRL